MATVALLKFLSENVYYQFIGAPYRQTFRVPIALALSSIYIEIALQEIENIIFQRIKAQPVLYTRYVVNALIVMNGDGSDLKEIRVELSSIMDTVKFATEYEQNKAIPYKKYRTKDHHFIIQEGYLHTIGHTERFISP